MHGPQIDGSDNGRNRRPCRVGTRIEHVGFLVGCHNAIGHTNALVQTTGFGDLDGLGPCLAAHLDRHLRVTDVLLADAGGHVISHLVEGHTLLLHGVTFTNGDGLIVEGVEVDGHA